MKLKLTLAALLLTILCNCGFVSAASVVTIAGTGVKGFSGDGGPALAAQLNNPFAIDRGPDGALYICDSDNHRIRRIAADGIISTFAGSGAKGYAGDGGLATSAALNTPYDLAWDKAGNLYFVEVGNHVLRKVEAKTGIISTVAGNGKPGFAGDGGAAAKAQFSQPHALAIDPAGDLYVCDIQNQRIRKIDMKTGTISTWAGTGAKKSSPDGSPFATSPLNGPRSLAFGADGKAILALRDGNAVLELDPVSGKLRRIAGIGKAGFTGNGGPAKDATLSGPKAVSLDANGNIYLADTESHSIRFVDAKTGTLELLVGDGQRADGPDGDPLKCRLARPHGVFVDKDGTVYIGDSENHRVRAWKR